MNTLSQFHSVRLDTAKCKGCTNCIKRCPTEAIRVRGGLAQITEDRCVDCGECIRVCPNVAKYAVADTLDRLDEFTYRIALPAPSLFAQFGPEVPPGRILDGLRAIGFDDVFEVALAAEVATLAFACHLACNRQRPAISSACPAVVRLIQVRFPSLVAQIVPVEAPMEVAARMARSRLPRGVKRPGMFFISPCPAKITAATQPVGCERSGVDGVLSMGAVYAELVRVLPELTDAPRGFEASGLGYGWGRAGGEALALAGHQCLAVDGIANVAEVLAEVERGQLEDIAFIEAQACTGGCVGGCLTVANPFVARRWLRELAETLPSVPAARQEAHQVLVEEGLAAHSVVIQPRPLEGLSLDKTEAIARLRDLEATLAGLPGLDCGSCGSPNCRALAEDIVRGLAIVPDCHFKLSDRVQELAEELAGLARRAPPAMGAKPPLSLEAISRQLGWRLAAGNAVPDRHVTGGYASDLLSDVIANARAGQVWVTCQSHPNIVAVAVLAELAGIVVAGGRSPAPQTVQGAEREGLPLFVTAEDAFTAAGNLYRLLAGSTEGPKPARASEAKGGGDR